MANENETKHSDACNDANDHSPQEVCICAETNETGATPGPWRVTGFVAPVTLTGAHCITKVSGEPVAWVVGADAGPAHEIAAAPAMREALAMLLEESDRLNVPETHAMAWILARSAAIAALALARSEKGKG